jgi:hypothetical protein
MKKEVPNKVTKTYPFDFLKKWVGKEANHSMSLELKHGA